MLENNPSRVDSTADRRTFLRWTAGVAAAVVALPVLQSSTFADDSANDAAADAGPTSVDAGPLSKFAAEGVVTTWAKKGGNFFLITHGGKVYAPSSICTHKGALLIFEKGNGGESEPPDLYCPRHRSHFDLEGDVTRPPAKKPLPRYGVSLNADKHVIVDLTRKFGSDQWNDPASFVKSS